MILKNARHERFAQELAKGKSAAQAYRVAGFKGDRRDASKLRQHSDISRRVGELLDRREEVDSKAVELAIERTAITKEWVMERLRDNAERAMTAKPVTDHDGKETGEYRYDGSVANRALELLGREIGMFVVRSETGRPGDFTKLSDDELADIARGGSDGIVAPSRRTAEPSKLH